MTVSVERVRADSTKFHTAEATQHLHDHDLPTSRYSSVLRPPTTDDESMMSSVGITNSVRRITRLYTLAHTTITKSPPSQRARCSATGDTR